MRLGLVTIYPASIRDVLSEIPWIMFEVCNETVKVLDTLAGNR